MSINIIFDGTNIGEAIEGFYAFNVTGRKMVESIIKTEEIGIRNGAVYRGKRWGGRTLVIQFAINAPSEAVLIHRCEQLNRLLDVEQAKISFSDDPLVYYVGTLTGMTEPKSLQGAASGKIEIYCSDPLKYAVQSNNFEYVPQAATGGYNCVNSTTQEILKDDDGNAVLFSNPTWATDYTGTYPTGILAHGTAKSEMGYIALLNEKGKVLQFGNPDEDDTKSWSTAEVLSNWTASATETTLAPYARTTASINGMGSLGDINGTIKVATSEYTAKKIIQANSYGTLNQKNHGSAVVATFPANSEGVTGATHCYMTQTVIMRPTLVRKPSGSGAAYSKDETGRINIGFGTASGMIAGVEIVKNRGSRNVKITVWINNEKRLTKTIKPSTVADKDFLSNEIDVSFTKLGGRITVEVGGVASKTVTVKALENVKVTRTVTYFGQYVAKTATGFKNCPVVQTMGLLNMYFEDLKVDKFEDVFNRFQPTDKFVIDTNNAEFKLNGVPLASAGALGNDWEDFVLTNGMNYVSLAYSDWASAHPTFDISYRKAYL